MVTQRILVPLFWVRVLVGQHISLYMRNILLKAIAKKILKRISLVIKYSEKYNQINEQWFINWLDELNRFSVKY